MREKEVNKETGRKTMLSSPAPSLCREPEAWIALQGPPRKKNAEQNNKKKRERVEMCMYKSPQWLSPGAAAAVRSE